MSFLKAMLANIKAHYDKLIAFVIFAILVGSLIYLAVQLGLIKGSDKAFRARMNSFIPRIPHAEKVDTAPFESARKGIFEPFTITIEDWTNAPLFVVEQRFLCLSCEKPIPWEAQICPFCSQKVPPEPKDNPLLDNDGDGLPNGVENAHRMDPNDPSDAHLDSDGDGFTNFEELTADPLTDPHDETDRPPDVQKLKVDALGVDPFRLRFKSHVLQPDGSLKFGLNLQKRAKTPRTYFRKLGEEVEGFKLEKYEEIIVDDEKIGKRDLSELTLKRGKKEIVLVKGQDVQHDEYLVRFYFEPTDSKFIKAFGATFDLKEITYKVIKVDISEQSVVIMRLSDSKELTIRKVPTGAGAN